MNRRSAIKLIAGAGAAASLHNTLSLSAKEPAESTFRLATFRADITPPLGSPLCGGWIRPAEAIDDRLEACGVVLFGGDKPIVLCALDWLQNYNSAHDLWREALAEAAGTDASHVAVQSVHPHDAPMTNFEAHALAQEVDPELRVFDPVAFRSAVQNTANSLRESAKQSRPITHVGVGEAKVQKVASNRRILGDDGKVAMVRMSRTTKRQAIDAPEGLIDPYLKTISFWNGEQPIAALHYYATHPMSHYGAGRVSSDFCGLARKRRQEEQPDVFQVYFNGCGGNVAAGKYNDGSKTMRRTLRDRIHAGMVSAWNDTQREPINGIEWSVAPVTFSSRTEKEFTPDFLRGVLTNEKAKRVSRLKAAMVLAWLARADRPIEISRLRIGRASLVHLPGEPFVEYQLFAQEQGEGGFVCVAGYGDGGMGYLPLQESFKQGGYEPTWSFIAPDSEQQIKQALARLLREK